MSSYPQPSPPSSACTVVTPFEKATFSSLKKASSLSESVNCDEIVLLKYIKALPLNIPFSVSLFCNSFGIFIFFIAMSFAIPEW